jgi:DNA-binding response OmpR family regulator
LTPREFDLLYWFARHPGEVFSRLSLLDHVWGYQHEGYEHTVNTHINRLRVKIEKDAAEPDIILTVWGKGTNLPSKKRSPTHDKPLNLKPAPVTSF